jgi:16S rRNA U516 pseudouridylate synthase RsuA-like enzyme
LIEGKNREIRRVFSYFHLHPLVLRRIRIGPVLLGDLWEGKTRPLSRGELDGLRGGKEGCSPEQGIGPLRIKPTPDERSGSW